MYKRQVQESKAEAAIEALQEIAAATSKVLRDGKVVTLKSDELVPGDVVLLEAGDAVPADGRIIEAASLKIEEAALTGESVPANKITDLLQLGGEKDVPLGDLSLIHICRISHNRIHTIIYRHKKILNSIYASCKNNTTRVLCTFSNLLIYNYLNKFHLYIWNRYPHSRQIIYQLNNIELIAN